MNKIYEYVTDRIVKRLEDAIKNGTDFCWMQPWNSFTTPKNFISKKAYKGINLVLLQNTGFYVTYNQLTDLREKYPFLKLKKGYKKEMVVYWLFKETKAKTDEDGEECEENSKTRKYAKPFYYYVINQKYIEGFEQIIPNEYKPREFVEVYEKAENIIDKYKEIVPIKLKDANRAFYTPTKDYIVAPPKECYSNQAEFFSSIFHEMIHSTGHKSRLNRELGNEYGSEKYSKEELVAEIGSQFLLSECDISSESCFNNSLAYLQGWMNSIKEDPALITFAAQRAQKAVRYVLENTIGEQDVTEKIIDDSDIEQPIESKVSEEIA